MGRGVWPASPARVRGSARPVPPPASRTRTASGRAGYRQTAAGRGRGGESDPVALERGRLDAVIARLLFIEGMRRSEVSVLRWARDVRFVKGPVLRALRTRRAAASAAPDARVVPPSPQMRYHRPARVGNGSAAVRPWGQFNTPLATLHPFNGWADKFLAPARRCGGERRAALNEGRGANPRRHREKPA